MTAHPAARIDAHQHFWRYDPGEYGWIDESMAALRRDFLPDDLAREMARAGVDACVAVQVRQTLRSPVTSSNIVDAMTWDARTVLAVRGNNLTSVRAIILEYVDHFIDDWKAVHR